MLLGNMLLVADNMLPVSRQLVSLCIQQQMGNKLATICLLPATCSFKQHVAGNKQHVAGQHVAWCKRGLTLQYNKGTDRYCYTLPSEQ